ncbi:MULTISPECIES: oxidoreductase [Paenibacillus]|uniref:2-enoate reductase n=3 Tax=Paenibacillus TaxID=44249 RepID=A0AAJ3IXP9_PAEPO|nr:MULTISPECIES: FAD-dependent oxidoreductase [Paenibacillus]ALA40648.1 2-enoate reductase [Paenibacillus peoriae]APQ57915.1 2-enoate reductase [Paenibacillus polymyxa]MCP3747858.1 FAD-dependent oxidoreductase [Paenibacillus sp. A3M_27_13]MDH2333671.1 FAD-dependent oxidoreductase [Paenibacillus polymyxa]MDR6781005.1 2-enoate reductase [Paenibacillus peoriae]
MKEEHRILFEPMKIGKLEIKNRFVMAPMGPGGLCDADGTFNERGVEYYVERAKGGTGLLITGVTMVENEIEKCALPSMPCPTLNPLNFVKTGKMMTERIHAYGTKIFLQLSAGFGRVSIPSIVGKTAVAPSPIPHRWLPDVICRELTIDEIHTYVRKFAESAAIAKKAGFDGIEIHAVHEGYLLDQFAISFFNHRKDQYGGNLRNRLRFAIEIVQAIKAECGQDFPVSLRYSIKSFIKDWRQGGLPGEEFQEQGRDIEEGIEAAKILEEAGYDAFNGDVGSYDSWYWAHPPMYQEKGLYLPYNKILKTILKVPVITAGRLDNPDLASKAIREGKTDMIALGRPLLADADIPNKIKAGKIEKIRPCLSCQEGCMGRLASFATISCAVNPACGREKDYALGKADQSKKVLVIGGGPAGCEAARVAAIRGHHVTLFDKNNRLGGNLIPGGIPDFKEDDHLLATWYEGELKDLKVDVQLNTEVNRTTVNEYAADVVIFATGSSPKTFSIGTSTKVYSAEEVLLGKKDPGASTVIVGGGLVGCETALWLADQGKKVTLVEMQEDILTVGGPLCHANEDMLRDLVAYKDIHLLTNAKIVDANDQEFVLQNKDGEETILNADSAILAVGYTPQQSLYEDIQNEVSESYLIGDAKQVQNIMYAVWDAYEVTRNI